MVVAVPASLTWRRDRRLLFLPLVSVHYFVHEFSSVRFLTQWLLECGVQGEQAQCQHMVEKAMLSMRTEDRLSFGLTDRSEKKEA